MLHRCFVRSLMIAASLLGSVPPFQPAAWGQAQTAAPASSSSSSVVPGLVRFSGTMKDAQGKALSGITGITFALYKDQEAGVALWQEIQNVTLDPNGRYTVQLGSTLPNGLPLDLFVSGEARWLGVQAEGQAEQPRVLLMSVPYALKAADAETVGGLPASAFMLAAPVASSPSTGVVSGTTTASAGSPAPPTVGGGGTANFIPIWIDPANLGNSVLFQSGTGSTAKIGINTTAPATMLDVKGGGTIRGTLNMPTQGTATATKGFNSQPITWVASAFNSGTAKAVNQTFAWQTQPLANNTSSPSGALNLLYSSGTGTLANTGLSIASNGTLTFAAGQTFPGTGTITGITPGTDLTGGGTSGNVTLNLDTTKVVTGVTAGTGLTGGGTGGVPTLSIDTTKVAQLNLPNTFTFDQTVNGNITATGGLNASTIDIGGSLFAFGNYLQDNAFVGFAGSLANTGKFNTGTGVSALSANTTGGNNTANGAFALAINNSGSSNTAIGQQALYANTIGSFNTATGAIALTNNTTGTNNTATGFQALYTNSTGGFNTAIGANALTANTTGTNNTATGYQALNFNNTGFSNTANGYLALANTTSGDSNTASGQQAVNGNTTGEGNTGTGFTAVYTNSTGLANTGDGYGALYWATGSFNSGLGYAAGPDKSTPSLSNTSAIGAFADVTVSNAMVLGGINGLNFATADTMVGIGLTAPTSLLHIGNRGFTNKFLRVEGPAKASSGGFAASFGGFGDFGIDAPGIVNGRFVVKESGFVGIGTASPDSLLSVNGSADKPGGGSWGTFSDWRLKTVGAGFNAGLSEILKLSPVHYRYKDENGMGIRDHDEHVGFVAQDVQRVIPEAVSENNQGYLLVNNDPILWAMLNAIKEQQGQIQQQRNLILTQQKQIALLRGKVGVLEAAQRTTRNGGRSVAAIRSADRIQSSTEKTQALNQPGN